MPDNLVSIAATERDLEGASIQVALVGGAQLHRAALRHLLERDADVQIVADMKTAGEMISDIETATADVVLLDIDDGSLDPLGLLQDVKSRINGAAILLLANGVEHGVIDRLLLAGARGFVNKEAAGSHLLHAIRNVHAGELWIDRRTASRLIAAFSERRRNPPAASERPRIESLSRREREVVTFVADGLCNKAIAKKMGISDNTVRHHLTSVYSKLDTRDRLELVIYAFRQGVNRSAN